jgi:hypothetical protein
MLKLNSERPKPLKLNQEMNRNVTVMGEDNSRKGSNSPAAYSSSSEIIMKTQNHIPEQNKQREISRIMKVSNSMPKVSNIVFS